MASPGSFFLDVPHLNHRTAFGEDRVPAALIVAQLVPRSLDFHQQAVACPAGVGPPE